MPILYKLRAGLEVRFRLGNLCSTTKQIIVSSVERVVEYLQLPQEPPHIIESNRPPAYWPSSSDNNALVSVEDVSIKYAPELPSVVQGVTFQLRAKERVGLLGRTGSGKSTLAMSLLRFVSTFARSTFGSYINVSTVRSIQLVGGLSLTESTYLLSVSKTCGRAWYASLFQRVACVLKRAIRHSSHKMRPCSQGRFGKTLILSVRSFVFHINQAHAESHFQRTMKTAKSWMSSSACT